MSCACFFSFLCTATSVRPYRQSSMSSRRTPPHLFSLCESFENYGLCLKLSTVLIGRCVKCWYTPVHIYMFVHTWLIPVSCKKSGSFYLVDDDDNRLVLVESSVSMYKPCPQAAQVASFYGSSCHFFPLSYYPCRLQGYCSHATLPSIPTPGHNQNPLCIAVQLPKVHRRRRQIVGRLWLPKVCWRRHWIIGRLW